jgi:ABC-2 type transport system ATP-binding protein
MFDKLTKHFGKLVAVDNLSFSVAKGEMFGFLGPNGAGKTTTIRCLMDFARSTSGTITVFNHDAQSESVAVRQLVRYVGSGFKLYDHWTGWDHLRFVEAYRGADPNISQLIEALNFDPGQKVRTLSFGTKQKLMLALALIGKPKLLVLDEPTVGLDPLLQNIIYELLKKLNDEGTTIFFSSHNLHEVELLCSRAAIIKQGRLVAIESIRELHKKKISTIQATFSGPYDPTKFGADNVTVIEARPRVVVLRIRGDINPTIQVLTKHKLTDLTVQHADLEDVFLDLYR